MKDDGGMSYTVVCFSEPDGTGDSEVTGVVGAAELQAEMAITVANIADIRVTDIVFIWGNITERW